MSILRGALCLAVAILLAGCQEPAVKTAKKKKKSRWEKGSEAAQKEKEKAASVANQGGSRAVPREGAVIRRPTWDSSASSSSGFGNTSSSSSGSFSRSESQAVDRIAQSIKENLELGPTAVVWVIDRSDSAKTLTSAALVAMKSLYETGEIADATKEGKLLTAVVGFSEKNELLLDPPSSDVEQIKAALDSAKVDDGSREATFATLKFALEKYLPLRTKERRGVIFGLVTDEPGDDLTVLDDVANLAQRNSIPIFVVGPSAPLGRATAPEAAPGGMKPAATSDTRTYAADGFYPDWITFATGGYGGSDMYDSSLGPWPLERLSRESGGQYLTVGGAFGASYGNRVDAATMSKYAPDYLTVKEMEASLAENKCRAALVAATKLPPVQGTLLNPQSVFPKRNEAEMARILNRAQLDAAKLEEGVNKLYLALAGDGNSIESDRAKLTGTRWQVAYDTALGRAAAAKVRIEGYNAMLAALKRGKPFQNETSTTWILEPSDMIETGSAFQKLAEKAKTYLEGVQKEHPNTPWAKLAEQELRTPLGWTWREQ